MIRTVANCEVVTLNRYVFYNCTKCHFQYIDKMDRPASQECPICTDEVCNPKRKPNHDNTRGELVKINFSRMVPHG